jgi:hypothetical protein
MIEKFREKYPLLFRDTNEMNPVNLFGIEVSQGWQKLLDTAFRCIYSNYRSEKRAVDYWSERLKEKADPCEKDLEYLKECKERLAAAEDSLPTVFQCKEKFGTLRLYCDNVSPYAQGVIDMVEQMSEITCEVCGDAGITYATGWHKTLCPEHAIKRYGKEEVEKYLNKISE